MTELITTKSIHFSNGEYNAARKTIHKEIVDKLLIGVPAKSTPSSFLLGGGTASGKSTVTKIIVTGFQENSEDVVVIDCDKIKTVLPEYEDLYENDKINWSDILHPESSDISDYLLSKCISEKRNFIFDGTMKNFEKYNSLINKLNALKYNVDIVVVDIPVEEAIKRSKLRFLIDGRHIHEDVIIEIHSRVSETFFRLKDNVKNFTLYDNSGDEPSVVALKRYDMETILDKDKLTAFFLKSGIII